MGATDFEKRKHDILEAIIEVYVASAAPVGSELISRKLRQSVSPATVRNVMAELEQEGLLEHPHTSAGRVPTDRGYRYYVDSLRDARRLTPDQARQVNESVRRSESAAASLLEGVGEVLSALTHHAAFVVAPTVRRSTIRQIELLPLSLHKLHCVLIGEEPFLASHTVELLEPISRDEAISLAHFLNTELAGLPADQLIVVLERRLLAVNDSFYHLVKRSLGILQAVMAFEPEERLLIEGAAYLFEYPEFHQSPERARQLLRQLELQEELLAQLRGDLASMFDRARSRLDGAQVRIGHEVGIEGLEECSYILAPFSLHQSIVGGIGILGPRRMDYRRMRALVEGVAGVVSEVLGQWTTEHGRGVADG